MHISVVNFKAFGDFVIAASAIRRINKCSSLKLPQLIAGEHVRSLASALNIEQSVYFLGRQDWKDVPAAFDVRKRGVFSAINSLIQIRQQFNCFSVESGFLFDKLGWRERFIGSGFQLHELSNHDGNIYIAYDNFFKSLGYDVNSDIFSRRDIRRAIIIPGARLSQKIIPESVILSFSQELTRRNIQTEIVVLDGEMLNFPPNCCVKKIPREFRILAEEISGSDLVVSADSLPCHLSEYLHVPIFVSTPEPNPYWLPRSSYNSTGWACFSDIHPFESWLDKYFHI